MNIREIETQLGIPRANVRYYEKEGLLHPARGANNYRIYTEDDVETLQKIRLLRQMDMPIETIRAVQAGTVPLTSALARQSDLLENSAARLAQARVLCRTMLEEQVTYPELNPARYDTLDALPSAPVSREPEQPPVEGAVWAFSPWQRYWARSLDFSLTGTAVSMVLALGFRFSTAVAPPLLVQGIVLVLSWALLLLWEPLALSTWGATPGKWLLGLVLRDADNRKLSFRQGRTRTWMVLRAGYGWEIPFYSLYRHSRCHRECVEGRPLLWDREEGFLYYSTVRRWKGRAVLAVGLVLALAPLEVWTSFQALLPPNRGEVTAAEFYENVNDMAKKLEIDLWVNGEGLELATQSAGISTNGGPVISYRYGEPVSDQPVIQVETDEAGHVRAVLAEAAGEGLIIARPGTFYAALLACLGTETSGWRLLHNPLAEAMNGSLNGWTGQPVRFGAFTLTLTMEQEGFIVSSAGYLFPDGNEEGWYRFAMRLERAAA